MSNLNNDRARVLAQADLEAIERIIHKTCDDLAVCVERGLERLEERLDGAETRIYSRLADLEECFRQVGRDEADE